ncbi:MAG TPA: hypothetical protein VK537_07580 [Galbitalea sp.]|nr:hypothetical protein [Galbitalea sp.]
MSASNRHWAKPGEPYCGEPHPTLKYLCGWNVGHDGDHMEAISNNQWPDERAGGPAA